MYQFRMSAKVSLLLRTRGVVGGSSTTEAVFYSVLPARTWRRLHAVHSVPPVIRQLERGRFQNFLEHPVERSTRQAG